MANKEIIGFLKAKKTNANSRLKAAERPKGVLIKYRGLLTQANGDQATLNNLNIQYRNSLLV